MKNKNKQNIIIITCLFITIVLVQSNSYKLEKEIGSNLKISVNKCSEHPNDNSDTTQGQNTDIEDQITQIAEDNDFKYTSYLIRLAYCESRFDVNAVNHNQGNGTDRGIFQINDKYHPEVSDECAFDLKCATIFTINAINNGNQDWWVCDKYIKNNFNYIKNN